MISFSIDSKELLETKKIIERNSIGFFINYSVSKSFFYLEKNDDSLLDLLTQKINSFKIIYQG